MKKMGWAAVTVLGMLVLSGCGEAGETSPDAPSARSAEVQEGPVETEAPEATPEAMADPTASGEVCDPQSGNDFPCLVAYPDIAVANMTAAGRSREPLSSMPDEDRIALAHQACEVLADGGSQESTSLVETVPGDVGELPTLNNFSVFSAGTAAYCPEFADQWVQDALAVASAG